MAIFLRIGALKVRCGLHHPYIWPHDDWISGEERCDAARWCPCRPHSSQVPVFCVCFKILLSKAFVCTSASLVLVLPFYLSAGALTKKSAGAFKRRISISCRLQKMFVECSLDTVQRNLLSAPPAAPNPFSSCWSSLQRVPHARINKHAARDASNLLGRGQGHHPCCRETQTHTHTHIYIYTVWCYCCWKQVMRIKKHDYTSIMSLRSRSLSVSISLSRSLSLTFSLSLPLSHFLSLAPSLSRSLSLSLSLSPSPSLSLSRSLSLSLSLSGGFRLAVLSSSEINGFKTLYYVTTEWRGICLHSNCSINTLWLDVVTEAVQLSALLLLLLSSSSHFMHIQRGRSPSGMPHEGPDDHSDRMPSNSHLMMKTTEIHEETTSVQTF